MERHHDYKEIAIAAGLVAIVVVHLLSMVYRSDVDVPQVYLDALNQNRKPYFVSMYLCWALLCYTATVFCKTVYLKNISKLCEQISLILVCFVMNKQQYDWGVSEWTWFGCTITLTIPIVWFTDELSAFFLNRLNRKKQNEQL